MKLAIGSGLAVILVVLFNVNYFTKDKEEANHARHGGRNLQLEVISGFFFGLFGRSIYCHDLQNGIHETIQVLRIFAWIHQWHGDTPGLCGQSCETICAHQPCIDDFEILENGDKCICKVPKLRKCGGNTQCRVDLCECEAGFRGDPYSSLGCLPDTVGVNLSGQWGTCSNLGGTDECRDELECHRTSRFDPTLRCCANWGPCNEGFTCCTDFYVEGQECFSSSRNDCEGDLNCGQRSRIDPTFICCKETYWPLGANSPVCKPF